MKSLEKITGRTPYPKLFLLFFPFTITHNSLILEEGIKKYIKERKELIREEKFRNKDGSRFANLTAHSPTTNSGFGALEKFTETYSLSVSKRGSILGDQSSKFNF